jgi:two-component system, response regulator YesN
MYSLLIVDDDYEVRRGLGDLFPWRKLGFAVAACVGDGRKALQYLNRNRVDVVLADVRMPFVSGLELARSLRESGRSPLVVLLSAYDSFDYARKGIEYGVRGYILKPTAADEIQRVFSRLRKELEAKPPEIVSDAARETGRPTGPEGRSRYYDRVVEMTRGHVVENLATATLTSAADAVGLSPTHLCRLFASHAGEGFSEFLTRTRMTRAQELLERSSARVSEIAGEVGYSTPRSFCRAFRRYFGRSPRRLRYGDGEG